MEYKKYFKYIFLLILGLSTVVVYLSFTNYYSSILQSLSIPSILSYAPFDILYENISMINQTQTNLIFESRLSDYYPRLPIHIFTQNLSLIDNKTKLILIGNSFFGDRNWGGFAAPGRSSTQSSKDDLLNIYICIN